MRGSPLIEFVAADRYDGSAMAEQHEGIKIIAKSRRAGRDFVVEDSYEAGMALLGSEVKSLREGTCSIEEAFARPQGNELFLYDMHIPPYEQATIINNHPPTRPRKLLLHRREIGRIVAQCSQRGYTLVPLRVYFKSGHAKVEIALARRKKHWDKREKVEANQRRKDAQAALDRRRR
jgi:SsrA-binding protein